MSQGEIHQIVFNEHPRLFTGNFTQCIDEAARRAEKRGVVNGLREAAKICARSDTYDTRKAADAIDRAANRLENALKEGK